MAALVILLVLAITSRFGGRERRESGDDFTPPASVAPQPPPSEAAERIGVMLSTTPRNRFFVPRELGVSWARANLFMGRFTGFCSVCELYERAGLDLVLTIFNSPRAHVPSAPADDLDAYADRIASVIDAVQPKVVAIENEQQNPRFFAGSPDQYGEMLAAACDVAHEKGIECTDGGLSAGTVRAVVYEDLIAMGAEAEADAYARGASFSEEEYEQVIDPANENLADLAETGSALLSTYADAGADYVNFHWYYPDPEALRTTIAYVEERTGLPAVTNEIGQVSPDPSTATSMLQVLVEARLPFAIWFSIDIDGRYHRTVGLHNPDGSLRANGVAFKNFLARAG